ncbi:MAG: CDP-diacylglycerol--serine O-phosphatidyltransferase [Sciscionella sp.]
MPRATAGIRLLPNAITVLAVCAGLSAVQFGLDDHYELAIAAIAVAAVLDGLDGRIARLLDATSRMGAELDSLCDAISFGVAPALTLYVWTLQGDRIGWVITLLFCVCMVLRLARFNTLLDDHEQLPFTKEFFVGVPAPAGGLLLLLPLALSVQLGRGWWDSDPVVVAWAVVISGLLISRLPTLSVKSVKVSPRAAAPLLVAIGLIAAAVITFPIWALIAVQVIYLLHLPYAVRRYRWLARHPEAWDVPRRERRAIRRNRSVARLGIRRPLRRRVAGAARRAVGRPRLPEHVATNGHAPEPRGRAPVVDRRRHFRRIGLRGTTREQHAKDRP